MYSSNPKIKLPVNIVDSDVFIPKIFSVFTWLLASVNTEDGKCGNEIIGRGSIMTKNATIAFECGLTIDNVRKALAYLQKKGYIKRERRYRNQIITVIDYESYIIYDE